MKNCVYRFLNAKNEVIYVGATEELEKRIKSHSHLSKECYWETYKIEYIEFKDLDTAKFMEQYFIRTCKPEYNTVFADKEMTYNSTDYDSIKWTEYKGNINKLNKRIITTKDALLKRINTLDRYISYIKKGGTSIRYDKKTYNSPCVAEAHFEIEKDALKDKLEVEFVKEGYSPRLAFLLVYRELYTKEELLEYELERVTKHLFVKCKNQIFKYGYYKRNIYQTIEDYFLLPYYSFNEIFDSGKTIKGFHKDSCKYEEFKIIDKKIRLELTRRIIDGVKKRLVDRFGEFKEELLYLETYDDYTITGCEYDFIKFKEPFVVCKPIKPINKRSWQNE